MLDTETNVTALNADGGTSNWITDTSGNNAQVNQTSTAVSSDRKTTTIWSKYDAVSGKSDQVETIAEQADGSIVDTVSDYSTAGSLIAQTIKTTAANGLSWKLTQDENGDGVVDNTQTDAIVLNTDGSTTETYTDSNGALNGSYYYGWTDSTNVVTTTSANGLDKTVVTTGWIEEYNDNNTLTDDTVINANGGTTETRTITTPGKSGQAYAWDTEIVNTSANGLTQTIQLSEYGDAIYDYT